MVLTKKILQGMLIIFYIFFLKNNDFFSGSVDPPPLIADMSAKSRFFLRPPNS